MPMNCIVVDDDKFSRDVIVDLVKQNSLLHLVKTCNDAMEAANVLRSEKIDLIFLDIEMPKVSGIEFMKGLTQKPQVILVTSKKEYALEAFEHDVTDYVLKPIQFSRFTKAVERANIKYQSMHGKVSSEAEELFVKTNNSLERVKVKDILFIEAEGNYAVINTVDQKLIVLSTMKELEDKLSKTDFMRIHRSFIVRVDKIKTIDDNVAVIEKKIIPIGRSYREDFMKRVKRL